MVLDQFDSQVVSSQAKKSFKEKVFLETLVSFGIKNCSVNVREGRFFDNYDISLPRGVRFSKVESIIDDLGIQMRSKSRPVGSLNMSKGCYSVKIQKKTVDSPVMENLLSKCNDTDFLLPIALGVDENGEDIFFDLNNLPNLIAAGATGSGKSVLLHNIILSAMHSGCEIILADPKFVEFSFYKNFIKAKNLVNNAAQFKKILSGLNKKMNDRFKILNIFGCRNVLEFNIKNPEIKMNPIVLVVDEWADLYYSDKTLKDDICSIAAKCRAAGISIVLATQRPSTDVISGTIKANFPGRIALRVSSGVDSRIILDKVGAEKIVEKGSGIFLDPSGSYVSFKNGYIKDVGGYLSENFTRRN
jgi:S-DNA-T family DNA segregation ATPase FtsK/SpoIIIE